MATEKIDLPKPFYGLTSAEKESSKTAPKLVTRQQLLKGESNTHLANCQKNFIFQFCDANEYKTLPALVQLRNDGLIGDFLSTVWPGMDSDGQETANKILGKLQGWMKRYESSYKPGNWEQWKESWFRMLPFSKPPANDGGTAVEETDGEGQEDMDSGPEGTEDERSGSGGSDVNHSPYGPSTILSARTSSDGNAPDKGSSKAPAEVLDESLAMRGDLGLGKTQTPRKIHPQDKHPQKASFMRVDTALTVSPSSSKMPIHTIERGSAAPASSKIKRPNISMPTRHSPSPFKQRESSPPAIQAGSFEKILEQVSKQAAELGLEDELFRQEK